MDATEARKRNDLCRSKIDDAKREVVFTFKNDNITPFVVSLDEVSNEIKTRLALRGLRGMIQSSYAKESEPFSAADAAANCFTSIKAGILLEGRQESPFWILALAELKSITVEEAAMRWEEAPSSLKDQLKLDPRVRAVKARMDSEAAARKAALKAPEKGKDILSGF